MGELVIVVKGQVYVAKGGARQHFYALSLAAVVDYELIAQLVYVNCTTIYINRTHLGSLHHAWVSSDNVVHWTSIHQFPSRDGNSGAAIIVCPQGPRDIP